jgi:hypothetical protein
MIAMAPLVESNRVHLAELCRRFGVRRLELFVREAPPGYEFHIQGKYRCYCR